MPGTKEEGVAYNVDEFDTYGRRLYYGNVQKQKGNAPTTLSKRFHDRYVVMRGWQLFWYRPDGDRVYKGQMFLPSQDVIIIDNDKK